MRSCSAESPSGLLKGAVENRYVITNADETIYTSSKCSYTVFLLIAKRHNAGLACRLRVLAATVVLPGQHKLPGVINCIIL
ncbi:hypothetical protein HZ326_24199 [Fusarium oxysporum f. sp. albedinis]|nr:hypothetical protein HZ326_24199 [Fusarium oxysporum f. sp. albedinis]